jgi:hypothetical protein
LVLSIVGTWWTKSTAGSCLWRIRLGSLPGERKKCLQCLLQTAWGVATGLPSCGFLPRPSLFFPWFFLVRKKGSGQPADINKHDLKILERFVRKHHRATAGNIKENI